jgi:type III secretion protein L
LARDREQVLEGAQDEGQRLIAEARVQAEALLADAREQHTRGRQDGFDEGMKEAAAAWVARALDQAAASQRQLHRQRDRLSEIVSMAVERVVEQEDRQALYQRALRSISKLVRDVPMLTLRVHGSDHDAAQRALKALADELNPELPIEVVADDGVGEGGCVFESDQGVIDAGLPTQLAAIKRAVMRAALPVIEPEESPEQPAPESPGQPVPHDEAQAAAVC